MAKFFKTPFAAKGDKVTIPDATTPDGAVSYEEGWTPDYERPLDSDIYARPVGRGEMNGVLNEVTSALRVHQTQAYPDYITAADNGGTQYPYAKGSVVRYSGVFYVSLIDNNTALPSNAGQWQPIVYQRASQTDVDNGTGDYLVVTPPTLKAMIDERLKDQGQSLAPNLLPVGACCLWFSPQQIPSGWLKLGDSGSFDTAANPKLAAIYPNGILPDPTDFMLKVVSGRSDLQPCATREGNLNNHYHITGRMSADAGAGADDVYLIRRGNAADAGNFNARGVFGEMNKFMQGAFPGSSSGGIIGTTDAIGNGGDLMPRHMGVCIIIKTDQADEVESVPTPTNIIISPSVSNVEVGKTQQFTAQVLPADLVGQYPVTWTTSDTSIGTIDSNGLFTAKSSGKTDIIASVSTGLSVRTSIQCDVLLASISMAAIPAQTVGNSYQLVITKTPSNATESLVFTSSDSSVASASSDGLLTASGDGTAMITVTGALSGKAANRTVTVNPAVVVETYLQIKNNLSELAEAGEVSQAAARDNLGLGELATKDGLAAADVGAVPVANDTIPAGVDLNTLTEPGEYYQNVSSNATAVLSYPEQIAGAMKVYKTGVDGGCRQVYMPYNSTVEYRRYAFGTPLVFSSWETK